MEKDSTKTLVDFARPGEHDRWEVLNDAVMGGVSNSSLSITPEGTAIFSGTVSLANSGGFASLRTLPGDFSIEGYAGLSVRARGDGKRYRLRLRTDNIPEGMAYQSTFMTEAGGWTTVDLPLSTFMPVFRGRIVIDAPPLEPGRITGLGIMIADRQEGEFSIEVRWVRAWRAPEA